jgi:hypothetical protein
VDARDNGLAVDDSDDDGGLAGLTPEQANVVRASREAKKSNPLKVCECSSIRT